MTTQGRPTLRLLARVMSLALVLSFVNLPPQSASAKAVPSQGGAQPKPTVTVANGLRTVTFDTMPGKIKVYLPDDMRAGDTISGTVVAEPKGQTEEERAKNRAEMEPFFVDLLLMEKDRSIPIRSIPIRSSRDFFGNVQVAALAIEVSPEGGTTPPRTTVRNVVLNAVLKEQTDKSLKEQNDKTLASITIPLTIPQMQGEFFKLGPSLTGPPSGGQIQISGPTPPLPTPTFLIPVLGQQGRPIEIIGPFDGDASNTTLTISNLARPAEDFLKPTENVSGGFGLIRPLAESPRKIVFESPTNFTGPAEIVLKEGDVETRGPYRNVGVRLSAPKTELLRGERTTVAVEVLGLQEIHEDVPLQLDTRGVVQMDGGNFQNLLIHPQEVQTDGRYTTTRAITGQQAGGFTVKATVIVRRFDMCLQDDKNPRLGFAWNSFKGDYYIPDVLPYDGRPSQPGGTVQPGGTTQTGGTTGTGGTGGAKPTDPVPPTPPGGLNLTGTGRPTMKGCIITLTHNAPDRRVFARLDVCNNTGDANVQAGPQKTEFKLTDTNTADNVCPSSLPR